MHPVHTQILPLVRCLPGNERPPTFLRVPVLVGTNLSQRAVLVVAVSRRSAKATSCKSSTRSLGRLYRLDIDWCLYNHSSVEARVGLNPDSGDGYDEQQVAPGRCPSWPSHSSCQSEFGGHQRHNLRLVEPHCCIDGYRDLSLMRASSVVKRQST